MIAGTIKSTTLLSTALSTAALALLGQRGGPSEDAAKPRLPEVVFEYEASGSLAATRPLDLLPVVEIPSAPTLGTVAQSPSAVNASTGRTEPSPAVDAPKVSPPAAPASACPVELRAVIGAGSDDPFAMLNVSGSSELVHRGDTINTPLGAARVSTIRSDHIVLKGTFGSRRCVL